MRTLTDIRIHEPEHDTTMMQEGTVKLDGVPLPAIQHAWLHSQVSIVAQEPVLFADTLYNNIAYGTAGGLTAASQSQVNDSLRLSSSAPAADVVVPGAV